MLRVSTMRIGGATHMAPNTTITRERVEVLWRVQTWGGAVWECVWYRTDDGFEFCVQRETDENDVIAVRRFSRICEAMEACADSWKRAALTRGHELV